MFKRASKGFVTVFIPLLGFFAGPTMAADQWMPKDCSITLTEQGARLSFPAVYDDNAWTWFQSQTRDDSLEYSFEVLLRSGKNTRGLGFYVFKLGGMHPASGSDSEFFKQGRMMVWTKVNQGRRLVPVQGVSISHEGERIIMHVDDRSTMHALFGSGARAALFSALHPEPGLTYGCVASVPAEARHVALQGQ